MLFRSSFLMLVAVFLLRVRLLIRQRRQRFYEAQWQPLLAECVFGMPAELPQVPRNMRYHFLRVWNFHHESLVGGTRANLEALAGAMHLEEIARELMHRGNLRERLIAVMTLGHLRDRTQWHELRALVADPSPMLSMVAARALLDIDASATLPWLVTVMAAREDWPLSRVASMLKEAGYSVVVIERNEANSYLPAATELKIPVIIGDATQRNTLEAARVEHARAIAVLTDLDIGIMVMVAPERPAKQHRVYDDIIL